MKKFPETEPTQTYLTQQHLGGGLVIISHNYTPEWIMWSSRKRDWEIEQATVAFQQVSLPSGMVGQYCFKFGPEKLQNDNMGDGKSKWFPNKYDNIIELRFGDLTGKALALSALGTFTQQIESILTGMGCSVTTNKNTIAFCYSRYDDSVVLNSLYTFLHDYVQFPFYTGLPGEGQRDVESDLFKTAQDGLAIGEVSHPTSFVDVSAAKKRKDLWALAPKTCALIEDPLFWDTMYGHHKGVKVEYKSDGYSAKLSLIGAGTNSYKDRIFDPFTEAKLKTMEEFLNQPWDDLPTILFMDTTTFGKKFRLIRKDDGWGGGSNPEPAQHKFFLNALSFYFLNPGYFAKRFSSVAAPVAVPVAVPVAAKAATPPPPAVIQKPAKVSAPRKVSSASKVTTEDCKAFICANTGEDEGDLKRASKKKEGDKVIRVFESYAGGMSYEVTEQDGKLTLSNVNQL